MSDPFLAEVRIFGFDFAPTGWAWCNGQLVPISQNTALFALLGSTYGGDGKSTFALPDLVGSVPMQPLVASDRPYSLSQRDLGEQSGAEYVTLLSSEIPVHTHTARVSGEPGVERAPTGQKLASGDGVSMYGTNAQPTTQMDPRMLTVTGASLPHNNMQPTLTLNFCIALQGVFPPRS